MEQLVRVLAGRTGRLPAAQVKAAIGRGVAVGMRVRVAAAIALPVGDGPTPPAAVAQPDTANARLTAATHTIRRNARLTRDARAGAVSGEVSADIVIVNMSISFFAPKHTTTVKCPRALSAAIPGWAR